MPHVKQHLSLIHPALSIICTSGPSIYETKKVNGICRTLRTRLPELLDAGMRMVRINFSHVQEEDYEKITCLIRHIRTLEKERTQPIPILMDLQGPEIRITQILGRNLKLVKGEMRVEQGTQVEISIEKDAKKKLDTRAKCRLVVSFEGELYAQMVDGEAVVIGDNEVSLRILEKVTGGVLSEIGNKGILKVRQGLNLPGRRNLEAPVLVENDKKALKRGFDIDLIAQSFVRGPSDVSELQGFLAGTKLSKKPIIAKIETPAAVRAIDAILQTRGVFGIMVARGDLGVLADYKQLPQLQEGLIDAANKLGKPVIVATQMLESMIKRPRPHRPEVQDIATAIREGADALMLSGETAVGDFPLETVSVMARVINENVPVDRNDYLKKFASKYALSLVSRPIDVLGYAICEVADEARSPFILSYASTGISATLISRFRPKMPVIAITSSQDTARKLCLLYNVYPVLVHREDLPRNPSDFIKFLREIVAEIKPDQYLTPDPIPDSTVFLVGTQELTKIIRGGKGQGIFVFEP